MADAFDTTRGWEGCYVTLQESYVRDLRLSGPSLLAFAIIRGFAAATGECTSTLSSFEWWLGCSKPTAIAAVHDLERLGLVSVGKRRTASGPLQNVYRLTSPALHPTRQKAAEDAWAVEDDSITLTGTMVSRLGLSGRDLVCYATLFARCQDGCEHMVPLSHVAAWMGSSQSTARRSMARLVEAGLVTKRIVTDERHVPQALYRLAGGASPQASQAADRPRTPQGAADGERGGKGHLVPRLVGTAGNERRTAARTAARDRLWSDFERLRPVVPTTKGFDYGFEAYRALRAHSLSHDEIEGLVNRFRKDWRASHPDRGSEYAPHCERVLREIARELDDAGDARPTGAVPGGDDARTLVRALQLDGRLGHEADRLVTERQRAASAKDRDALAKADARIHEWCGEHEAEGWGTAELAGGGDRPARAPRAAEGTAV